MKREYFRGIFIEASESQNFGKGSTFGLASPEEFIRLVALDLYNLASRPIGRDLVELIGKRNAGIGTAIPKDAQGNPAPRTTTIIPSWGTMASPSDLAYARAAMGENKFNAERQVRGGADPLDWSTPFAKQAPTYPMTMAGRGSSVTVGYNPKFDYRRILKMKSPSWIVLGHELIHALHAMSGDWVGSNDGLLDPPPGHRLGKLLMSEEARTVGAGTYANIRISENALRREWGLDVRSYYNIPGDCMVKEDAIAALGKPKIPGRLW